MEVNSFNISKHLSGLVGRHVAVKIADGVKFTAHTRVACYKVAPLNTPAVVKVDLHLMASLGGTMLGFLKPQIDAQIRAGQLDDDLTDASGELMNVLSSVIVAEGRAIFKGLFVCAADYSMEAADLVRTSCFPVELLISLSGYQPGHMVIFPPPV